jgi:hypothetical protein
LFSLSSFQRPRFQMSHRPCLWSNLTKSRLRAANNSAFPASVQGNAVAFTGDAACDGLSGATCGNVDGGGGTCGADPNKARAAILDESVVGLTAAGLTRLFDIPFSLFTAARQSRLDG